jgi:hypothetical protein
MHAHSRRVFRFSLGIWAAFGLLALASTLLVARWDGPAAADPQPDSNQIGRERLPGLMEVSPEKLSHRLLEVRERLELEQSQLAKLNEAYRQASDDAAATQVRLQIHELKTGTEAAILEIQLRHARAAGEPAVVEQLEAVLESADALPPQSRGADPVLRKAGGR